MCAARDEPASMYVATWTCPYCDESGQLVNTADVVKSTSHGSFLAHLRNRAGNGHGKPERLPDDFARHDAETHITVESASGLPIEDSRQEDSVWR